MTTVLVLANALTSRRVSRSVRGGGYTAHIGPADPLAATLAANDLAAADK
jgi:hypothetical protein